MAGGRESKTEKPTPRRLREARREGRIPKSPEAVSWAGLLLGVFLVRAAFGIASARFQPLLRQTGVVAGEAEIGPALTLLGQWATAGLLVVAPIALGTMVLGIITNLGQTGFAPSAKLLKPKFERINPFKGLKRLLGPQTLWETLKQLLKVGLMGLVAWRTIHRTIPSLLDAGRLDIRTTAGMVADSALTMTRDIALVGLLLAAVDYGITRRRIMGQLRMTKQELKEDHRQSEGDPMLKGHIRSKQLAVSRNRMMAAVATADVVLVNPTHVAVALSYDPLKGPPRVVAKGAGVIATRIREEADQHGVPMVEDIPLARAIFRACELGEAIPTELFDAVARVLAFIFALKRRGTGVTGIHQLPRHLQSALVPA
jgi:flagellar biosynthetic protein FlhB